MKIYLTLPSFIRTLGHFLFVLTSKSELNVQKFITATKCLICLSLIHISGQVNANSLRDQKGAQFQAAISQFDLSASNFLRVGNSGIFDLLSARGDATPIFKNLQAKAIENWHTLEPRDFKNISLLYNPYCLAQVQFIDLKELNFIGRRNSISNAVEANFQKFGAIETPDFSRIVESSRVLHNNLITMNRSLNIIPIINGQINKLQEYISEVESSHLHLFNLVSVQLAKSANISESINALYALKSTLSDSTEIDIIDRFIVLMTELNKLPIQTDENLKALQGKAPAAAVIEQIDFFKTTITDWQEKLQSSYNETKGTIDKLDADIAYARTQMADAEAAVEAGIVSITNLEAEADSKVRENFQLTDARVKEIVAEWNAYKKSTNNPNYNLYKYTGFLKSNYLATYMSDSGGSTYDISIHPGCVDYSE
jgi:hypothetical protein